MKNTAKAIVLAFIMIALLQPRTPQAAHTREVKAVTSTSIFLAGMALLLVSAYEFGISVTTNTEISCLNNYYLACCSMNLGFFANCQTTNSSCPDGRGQACLPINKSDPITYPLYTEKNSKVLTASILAFLGAIGVISAIVLHGVVGRNSVAPVAAPSYPSPVYAPPTYSSTSSLPPYQAVP